MSRVEVFQRSESLITAAYGPVFFEVWTGPGGLQEARAMHADHMRYVRGMSGKTALFSAMLSQKVKTPDAPTRAFLETRVADLNPHLVASALYIAAQGLGAAIGRSIIGSLVLLKRGGYPTKVFSEPRPACDWIASMESPALASAPSASDLLAAFESVRRAPPEARPA